MRTRTYGQTRGTVLIVTIVVQQRFDECSVRLQSSIAGCWLGDDIGKVVLGCEQLPETVRVV